MIKVKLSKETKAFIGAKIKLIKEKQSCIYFLKHNDVVVYVGQSTNLRSRIKAHIAEKTKVFSDFTFINCPIHLLDESETAYIYKHDPIFNKVDSLTDGICLKDYCDNYDIDYSDEEDMSNMKKLTIKIRDEDYETFMRAAQVAYDENKHRKDYGISMYIKESALNRAKRLLKK